LALTAPVYARRGDLLRTVRATKKIEGPGKTTSLELRPGVAVRPASDGSYLVLTNRVRTKLALDPGELTTELATASLAPDTSPDREPMLEPPPERPRSPLRVGSLEVHLSKKTPPPMVAVAGSGELVRVETPCVTVVGALPPDPRIREAVEMANLLAQMNVVPKLASPARSPSDSIIGILEAGVPNPDLDDLPPPGAGVRWVEPRGGLSASRGDGGTIGDLKGGIKAPPAAVRLGALATTGSLPVEAARSVVMAATRRFRKCYDKGVLEDPELAGRILLSLRVDERGAVSLARSVAKSPSEPGGTDLASEAVIACVVEFASTLRFPKPDEDAAGEADVLLTLIFAPG
jgi:hypothetical protein